MEQDEVEIDHACSVKVLYRTHWDLSITDVNNHQWKDTQTLLNSAPSLCQARFVKLDYSSLNYTNKYFDVFTYIELVNTPISFHIIFP